MSHQPPPYLPIEPLRISERWFPKGLDFGLYESGGVVCPNVTSILAKSYPFDRSKWVEKEPDIDHDEVVKEAAERGTAVHLAMERWLTGESSEYDQQYAPWVEPLRALVAKAQATLAVEIPVHYTVPEIGGYAGSADGLMLVGGNVVILDYKTKRESKRVIPRFQEKQRTQLAAYSIAINALYADQLPGPVDRCSLLYAHPEPGRAPTVIATGGSELKAFQENWLQLLSDWYAIHGDSVAAQQEAFDRRRRDSAA